jgi:hypothetical protein
MAKVPYWFIPVGWYSVKCEPSGIKTKPEKGFFRRIGMFGTTLNRIKTFIINAILSYTGHRVPSQYLA